MQPRFHLYAAHQASPKKTEIVFGQYNFERGFEALAAICGRGKASDEQIYAALQSQYMFSRPEQPPLSYKQTRAMSNAKSVLTSLRPLIPNGVSTYLDIGSGDGLFADAVGDALGVRRSDCVDIETEEFQNLGTCCHQTYNGCDLPYADESFDLVTASQVLHHVRLLGPLLGDIARVLRPDGLLCVKEHHAVPGIVDLIHVQHILPAIVLGQTYRQFAESYTGNYKTIAELETVMGGHGFRPLIRDPASRLYGLTNSYNQVFAKRSSAVGATPAAGASPAFKRNVEVFNNEMSSKKKSSGTRYGRIFQWIQEQDPDFAAAISRLDLESKLSPTHNPGITFLYPDAQTRAELVKQAYGDDTDAAEAGVLAHIVPLYVETGDAFAAAGNRLGTAFSAGKATASSAEIAPGVEVRREPGFRPERQAAKLAVWRVTAGAVPTTAPDPASRWKAPQVPRSFGEEKKAAEPPAGPSERFDRYRVARVVEKEYAAMMDGLVLEQRRDAARRCMEDPYLDKVASFLEWAVSHDEEAYDAVLPLLEPDPAVTFYLIFEPYRSTERGRGGDGDGYVVSDSCLTRWTVYKATSCNYDEAVRSFHRHYDTAAKRAGVSSVIIKETDSLRCDLLELKRAERCNGVYGAYTKRYGGSWARWLWRDEFRHCIGSAFQALRQRWEHAAYKSIITSIQTVWTGADPNRRALCTELQRDVSGQNIKALNYFLNSSDFLYRPYSWEWISKPWGTGKDDDSPHNRSAALASYLGGLTKMRGRKRRGRKSAASSGASSFSEVADGDSSSSGSSEAARGRSSPRAKPPAGEASRGRSPPRESRA